MTGPFADKVRHRCQKPKLVFIIAPRRRRVHESGVAVEQVVEADSSVEHRLDHPVPVEAGHLGRQVLFHGRVVNRIIQT